VSFSGSWTVPVWWYHTHNGRDPVRLTFVFVIHFRASISRFQRGAATAHLNAHTLGNGWTVDSLLSTEIIAGREG
jgi:hypothetical protein